MKTWIVRVIINACALAIAAWTVRSCEMAVKWSNGDIDCRYIGRMI